MRAVDYGRGDPEDFVWLSVGLKPVVAVPHAVATHEKRVIGNPARQPYRNIRQNQIAPV